MIEITDAALRKAAGEGMDTFIQVFTDRYKEVIGGELTAESMPLLTGEQHTLLAYQIFRDEVMDGGFCQLIQNGYGGYIFANPFAKVMLCGERKISENWYIELKRFMMPIAKIWNGNVQMMNSWLCTSNMKLSMNWKKNFWKKRKESQLW